MEKIYVRVNGTVGVCVCAYNHRRASVSLFKAEFQGKNTPSWVGRRHTSGGNDAIILAEVTCACIYRYIYTYIYICTLGYRAALLFHCFNSLDSSLVLCHIRRFHQEKLWYFKRNKVTDPAFVQIVCFISFILKFTLI